MSARQSSGLLGRVKSFAGLLRIFFFVVVIVPAIAIAIVLFGLIAASARGQLDARLAARVAAVTQIAEEARSDANRIARATVRDARLERAVRRKDPDGVTKALNRLVDKYGGNGRIAVSVGGRRLGDVGPADAILHVSAAIRESGRQIGTVEVTATSAASFAALARRIAGRPVIIRRGSSLLVANPATYADVQIPKANEYGDIDFRGERYRVVSFESPSFANQRLVVSVLASHREVNADIRRGRIVAVVYFLGFLLLSLTMAVAVSRELQEQVTNFLAAARRIGGGDFTVTVPIRGIDGLAQLGTEFNNMAYQLQEREDDLDRERTLLTGALRRLGLAFASSLDRRGLLEIVVETGVDVLGADGARARIRLGQSQPLQIVSAKGALGDMATEIDEAEAEVLTNNQMVVREGAGCNILAYPLRAETGSGDTPEPILGLIVVWRANKAFTETEREMFEYLAAQAAVSVQNVGHYENVERAASIDVLTGLASRRAFEERLANEVKRAKRLNSYLALVLMDIDDFKVVNDTYGHQQGDAVLRGVADVLTQASRDLDLPGRLGGEELAVVLPSATPAGAYEFGERARKMVESLRVARIDDSGGPPLQVTASFGVAAARGEQADPERLYADSDQALYRAKRAGKNRVESAL